MKKIKVVWLCHFTNKEIQRLLNIKKNVPEFAPWINIGIKEAEKRKDIELYIVSPHRWIRGIKYLELRGIHYYFFNSGIFYFGRHWPGFFRFDVYTNYFINKKIVQRIVDKIKPDIIHLHGLENAYYSSTVFPLMEKYKIIATIQGFINAVDGNSYEIRSRKKVEIELLEKIKYFGVRTKEMIMEIKKYNKRPVFFLHEYFINIPKFPQNNFIKDYDIIYFARVTRIKGIEDLIISLKKVVKKIPDIKVVVIGSGQSEYMEYLKSLAEKNNCINNIEFRGMLNTQEEVFEFLMKSKVTVLPTYADTIPGTIIESMFAKVSVVSYSVGGIPEINEGDKRILLSKPRDITSLANNILSLLRDEKLRESLAEKAYSYAIKRWNNAKSLDDIVKAYRKILN